MLTGPLNKLKVVAIAAVTLLVLIIVLQITQAVETHLLFLTLTMPNAALLLGTLIIGFAIGVLTASHGLCGVGLSCQLHVPMARRQTGQHTFFWEK